MQSCTHDHCVNHSMHAEDNRLGAHLIHPDSPVQGLLRRASRLEGIQTMLRTWAREPLASSLRVANEREGVVVVFVESAAAHTQLRYRQQDMLQVLRDGLGNPTLQLEIKMRPTSQD